MSTDKHVQDARKLLAKWTKSPLSWVEDNFPTIKLSSQQREFFVLLGEYVGAKIKVSNGEEVTEEEAALAKKIGFSITAGQGCHAINTPILMYDGTTKMVQDVKVGDLVMGDDSTPRNVLSLARGREKMYRISYRDGTYYDVNENHILSLRCSDSHGVYNRGDVMNVTVKEYLTWSERKKAHVLGYRTGVDFPPQTEQLKIPPYILGIWLGDGCFSAPELTTVDPELIEVWGEWGKSLGLELKERSYKAWRITKGRKGNQPNKWMDMLKDEGLYRNKHIPQKYLVASRQDRLELLAGLIDTDGTKTQRRNKSGFYELVFKDENLASQVRFLARSLGFHCIVKQCQKSWEHNGVKNTGTYYRISVTRNGLADIPVRIERKKFPQDHKYMELNFGIKVTELGEGDYYGFELDGNNLFVMGDFTVTHNTGKDFITALVIYWFLWCNPRAEKHPKYNKQDKPKVVATGVGGKHLRNVLWAELSKIAMLSKAIDPKGEQPILKELFDWQTEKLTYRDKRYENWFAEAVTVNANSTEEEQARTLYGRHAHSMMIVADEAAGIPDPVFTTMEGTMTDPINFALMIFNPILTKGYAIRSQNEEREKWIALRWDAEESELVSRDSIERKRKYGEDSYEWRVLVKGLPPLVDANTLIPPDWVLAAIDKDIGDQQGRGIVLGCDVGLGGDKSVVAVRHGNRIIALERNSTADTTELVDWITALYMRYDAGCAVVDNIGVGAGVYDYLRKKSNVNARKGDARQTAWDEAKFFNKRAQAYWRARELFEAGNICIPNDTDLINQVSCITYDPANKNKIGDKKEIRKKLGGKSPDDIDSIVLSLFVDDKQFTGKKKSGNKVDLKGVFMR